MDKDNFELDNEITSNSGDADVSGQSLMDDICDDWSALPIEKTADDKADSLPLIDLFDSDDQNIPGPNKTDDRQPNKVEGNKRGSLDAPNRTKIDPKDSEGSEPMKDGPNTDKPNVVNDGGANSVNGGEYRNPEARSEMREEVEQKTRGEMNRVEGTPERKPEKQPMPTDTSGYGELKADDEIAPAREGGPEKPSSSPEYDPAEVEKKKAAKVVTT